MATELLQPFWTKRLSNASYGAFIEAFSGLIAKGTTEKLGLKAEDYSAFQNLLAQLLEVNNSTRKDQATQELEQLDRSRDQILNYVFGKIVLESQSPDESIQKAWLQLLPLREMYKGLQKKANREETYLIKGLLVDTEKVENKEAFQKLGLTSILTQLKTVNEAYESTTESRAESQVANALPSAKVLRGQIDEYYASFTTKIGALAIVSPNAELEAFVKSFNKLAKDSRELWKLHLAQIGKWTEEWGWEEGEGSGTWGTGS